MSNVKIYIAYHRPYPIVKSDIFSPINLGRSVISQISKDGALSEADISYMMNNMIGDDTGDNISEKNRKYCELTGLYWIWKNCLNDERLRHIGYMSYRRMFIFNNKVIEGIRNIDDIAYNCYAIDKSMNKIHDHIGLDSDSVASVCNRYDCILPYKVNLAKFGIKSVLHDYVEKIPGMHLNDILLLNDYMYDINQNLGMMFKDYLYSNTKYMYQCFIATKEIFENYCKFVFDILFAIEKTINVDLYTTNGKRTLAYLGEQLYGFYFSYLLDRQESMKLHLPLTFLK